MINLDSKLKTLFPEYKEEISMFSMTKEIGKHVNKDKKDWFLITILSRAKNIHINKYIYIILTNERKL